MANKSSFMENEMKNKGSNNRELRQISSLQQYKIEN